MDSRKPLPGLDELWGEAEPSALRCYECKESFEDDAIIRTFRVQVQESGQSMKTYSKRIVTPRLQIVLFDRHWRCRNSLRYICVSHVWDPTVSKANLQGREKTTPTQETQVRNYIFGTLENIATGLKGEIGEEVEIWYDYISVPQWAKPLKNRIIDSIPNIFQGADFTLIHLDDIDNDTLDLLRNGKTQEDRLSGITGVCNSKWFKRVWTAMEYVRSDSIRVMDGQYQVMSGVSDCLLLEVNEVWDKEVANAPSVHHIERIADMGNNIVPWNLGPLDIGHDAKVLDFGTAFSLLSKRGCSDVRDFFTALLGIVRGKFNEPLSNDPQSEADKAYKVMLQIAISCMEVGDYSPLLMMPRSSEDGITHNWYATEHHKQALANLFERCGYFDVLAYGLGPLSGLPTYHAGCDFKSFYPSMRLKLGKIGLVTFAMSDTTRAYPLWQFITITQTVLTFTGPHVENFVKTVCSRLFNICDDDVAELLLNKKIYCEIDDILIQWYNKSHPCLFHDEELRATGQRLAHLLGLYRTHPKTDPVINPIDYMSAHGGTLHNGNPGTLIAARCPGCSDTHVYRAAVFQAPSLVYGSVAYRLSGVLHQERSTESLGILVKDGEIVGRLIWASPACDCRETGFVDISLRKLPMRKPRHERE